MSLSKKILFLENHQRIMHKFLIYDRSDFNMRLVLKAMHLKINHFIKEEVPYFATKMVNLERPEIFFLRDWNNNREK